jgi:hypothetical protein
LKFSKQFENVVAQDELSAWGERSRNESPNLNLKLTFPLQPLPPELPLSAAREKKLAQISGQFELVRKACYKGN